MTQLEEINIFLGSPRDVSRERKHVQTVVNELNRTVAASKGLYIRVTSSDNAFPGYGKDAQSVINEQIAQMCKYDIFIGIMWKRIGTPTPRAKSGTVEELSRAIQSFNNRKKPEIWFYFRTSSFSITTKKEAEKVAEVMDFKNRFRRRSLFREYESPIAFSSMLREHLCLWLATWTGKGLKPPTRRRQAATKTKNKQEPTEKLSPVKNVRKNLQDATSKTEKRKPLTKPSRTSRSSKGSAAKTKVVKPVNSPKDWVMLDDLFFKAKFSTVLDDKRISLQIITKDLEEISQLKRLYPSKHYHRGTISFADSHEARLVYVSSMTIESASGESIFDIMLEAAQRSQSSGLGIEMNYPNYTADQVAELRIRLLLLGEPLPEEVGRYTSTRITRASGDTVVKDEIFSALWKQLQIRSSPQFLQMAWLWAAYNLKMSQIIEDILELELGPIKNKVMPVKFRGKRRELYLNTKDSIVSITGNCKINV